MHRIIIAIDGYSACGKSTTARETARILGYRYIDSGAMYRAVTLYFLEKFVSLDNPHAIESALRQVTINFEVNSRNLTETFLNGLNVETEIRKMPVSGSVSRVSAIPAVRTAMVQLQRKLGKDNAVVMDGRDIGTAVFPNAELKFFMTADITVRAYRRQKELLERGTLVDLEEVMRNITERDRIDTGRSVSPLRKAADAIEMDTTYVTIDEQVDDVVREALHRIFSR